MPARVQDAATVDRVLEDQLVDQPLAQLVIVVTPLPQAQAGDDVRPVLRHMANLADQVVDGMLAGKNPLVHDVTATTDVDQ